VKDAKPFRYLLMPVADGVVNDRRGKVEPSECALDSERSGWPEPSARQVVRWEKGVGVRSSGTVVFMTRASLLSELPRHSRDGDMIRMGWPSAGAACSCIDTSEHSGRSGGPISVN
jgi:hypothetical protein